MSKRICLTILAASFALAVPTASLAQSSSQAQYQGVAPETQSPVTGTGNGSGGTGNPTGGSGGTSSTGGANATGANGQASGTGGTSGASGNGGGAASSGGTSAVAATPSASDSTSPFSSGDFVWIVLACAGLAGLGFVLRRMTRNEPAGV